MAALALEDSDENELLTSLTPDEASDDELNAFWAKQKERMYSFLPKKVSKFVEFTNSVPIEGLVTPPEDPHSFGWIYRKGSWYAAWYPDLNGIHPFYVYLRQCVVVPIRGALYLPRIRGEWFHFEDPPKEVTELLQKKLPTHTKSQRTYKKEFRLSFKLCSEYYEAAKKKWFEKQRIILPMHEKTTLCVGDVLRYNHVLPNFQTQILEIKPPVYYEKERDFCYAKLRAIVVQDIVGSIMSGGQWDHVKMISKRLSNGCWVTKTIGNWNIEPEGRTKGIQTFEKKVCKIARGARKKIRRKTIKILALESDDEEEKRPSKKTKDDSANNET